MNKGHLNHQMINKGNTPANSKKGNLNTNRWLGVIFTTNKSIKVIFTTKRSMKLIFPQKINKGNFATNPFHKGYLYKFTTTRSIRLAFTT